MGVGGVRTVDIAILRTTLAPMRLEVTTEAGTADVGKMDDMDTVESIMCVIDLVSSRCPSASRSTNARGKSLFDSGYTKCCTSLPTPMPRSGHWCTDWSRTWTKSISRKCGPCDLTLTMRSSVKS